MPQNPRYLGFIRTLPCTICGTYPTEAAHTKTLGSAGMSQKAPDESAIPLCHADHQTSPDSYHRMADEPAWAIHHALDLSALVARLRAAYELMSSPSSIPSSRRPT